MDNVKDITLIQGPELAQKLGFSGVTAQFRAWTKSVGIRPLPGRKNVYDPKQVRACLDKASGLAKTGETARPASLTAQRKARKNAK